MSCPEGAKLVARTVLDLRATNRKYISQTLLLAASWSQYASQDAELEVLTVGGEDARLNEFLYEIGARHTSISPSKNDVFSKHSNKIEASGPDPSGARVLLLDNDVCFLGSLAELKQLPADAVVAAEPGVDRVGDPQWELIRREIGLPLLRFARAPLSERRIDGGPDDPAVRERWFYANSGVILFPSGHDHRAPWCAHQREINAFFREHPLMSDAVTSSDQAGFASSVAAHGAFAWLPVRFNYRPPCFERGLESLERIGILHFTGDIRDTVGLGMADRMSAYWDQRILPRIAALPPSLAKAEQMRRQHIALDALAMVKRIISDYDLETWLHGVRPRAGVE